MSRKDKRSGRASYRGANSDLAVTLLKAVLGKDYSVEVAPYIMLLALLPEKGDQDLQNLRYWLLNSVRNYAVKQVWSWDGDGLIQIGRMLNRCFRRRVVDPNAVEIILTYVGMRMEGTSKQTKGRPSGKDLARKISEVRERLCVPPLEKTHDAIRERALRLGLKLKGKRKKKK